MLDKRFIQTQSNLHRSSADSSGGSAVGSNNEIVRVNVVSNTTDSGVRSLNGELGAGEEEMKLAFRPYRLIPYGRNDTFTGRTSHLESVKRFSERKGHNRVALYGLGGSGKTQIALEYVYQRAGESDCHIFWVQGSGILEFSEGFRAVAKHARVPLAGAETDEEDFLLGIRRWLEGPDSGDWILVIDNADNEIDFVSKNSEISKFIPQTNKGTLVFTTRSRQVAFRQRCQMIEVGKLGEEEAQELFSQRFGNWDSLVERERKIIPMILGSVDYLPLAVVGSAAFMTDTATPPSVYWAILQEDGERMRKLLSQEFCDTQCDADATKSILGTYFVTFDRIKQQMPAAADLLRLMAFLNRQNIPEELLSQSGLEGVDDSVEFRRAIGKLLGFSLVSIFTYENKTFYELHRLVQLSLQVYLPMEELNQWGATALQVIARLFPRDWNGRQCVGRAYIPHALAVTKDSTDPIAEELCFHMGQYFLDMGSYNHAETQFSRWVALREEGKGYNWDDEGYWRLTHLGLVKAYLGKYDDSEVMIRRALEGLEKVHGLDHPSTLTGVNSLAMVLRFRGRYNESAAMNRCALMQRERLFGPDHPDTLESVSNLAWVLESQGMYGESERMNRRALEGREKVLGPDHPDTLRSVSNLAAVLMGQGKYYGSVRMNQRALERRGRVLGPDHPDTLESTSNLAVLLSNQGMDEESETMGRGALEGLEEALGPDHPDTLRSVNNLGVVLQLQGKYHESKTMHRRALVGREKILGPDHPDTLTSVHNLAVVLRSQGKYNESETMHQRALDGYEKLFGPDHPHTLTSVGNLAVVLQDQGKYKESEMMHQRALEGHEELFGPDHPNTLIIVGNLAVVLRNQGKYDESETMHRRALAGREKILGPDHPDTLIVVNNLAVVLQVQGKYDESVTMHQRALEGNVRVLGPDHPGTQTSAHNLATVLRKQGMCRRSEMLNRCAW